MLGGRPLTFPARGLPAAAGLLLLLWAVVAASWFLRHYFGPVTLDQLLFHLEHGGLDHADPRMLKRGLRCLLAVLALTGLSLLVLHRLGRWMRRALWLVLGGGALVSVQATVTDPCQGLPDGGDYLAQHYVDPAGVQLQVPAVRPDVLVVFVESLDQDYTRTRTPEAPLLPQLTRLQDEFQTLGELRNLSGAAWTIGGLFTALCGLPLQPVGLLQHNGYEYGSRFFAGGRCLTDLLAAQGWEISFYGGASLKFAGKGRFLADHGVARRFGADEWRQRGVPVPKAGWGLLDSALTEEAWADMQRPRERGLPRMSLLLTVDTHGPMGAFDPGCPAEAPTAGRQVPAAVLRGALRCTDRVVARLVERFVAQRDGRPKVVWIMGDHLNPEPLLTEELVPASGGRSVFHALARYDAAGRALPMPDQQRQFTHVDVLPTLAEALGLRWAPQAHRLGLGVSLLADQPEPTLTEWLGLGTVNGRLSCRSPLYQRLWLGRT